MGAVNCSNCNCNKDDREHELTLEDKNFSSQHILDSNYNSDNN